MLLSSLQGNAGKDLVEARKLGFTTAAGIASALAAIVAGVTSALSLTADCVDVDPYLQCMRDWSREIPACPHIRIMECRPTTLRPAEDIWSFFAHRGCEVREQEL